MRTVLAFFLALHLAFPLPYALAASCDAQCDQFKTGISDATLNAACPTGQTNIVNTVGTFPDTDSCKKGVQDWWNQMGPHCVAVDAYDSAIKNENITETVWGISAAVCAVACYDSEFEEACKIAAIANAVVELGADIDLYENGQKFRDWVSSRSELGTGAMAYGAYSSSSTATSNASNGTKDTKNSSCTAMYWLLAGTILKGMDLSSQQSKAEDECTSVMKFSSPGNGFAMGASPTPKVNPMPTSNDVLGPPSSGTNLVQLPPGSNSTLPPNIFGEGTVSGATAGGFGKIFSQIQNHSQIPHAFESAFGMDANQFGQKVAASGAAAAMASLPGVPEFSKTVRNLEKDAEAGKLKLNGQSLSSASYTSRKGGQAAPKGKPRFRPLSFGFDSQEAPAVKSSMSFARAPAAANVQNGDIWHTNYNGTIFQVVSSRVVKSLDRVDHLDWTLPLNRMLAGAPAVKSKK